MLTKEQMKGNIEAYRQLTEGDIEQRLYEIFLKKRLKIENR